MSPETFDIGGELRVHRLGFGAMRLPAAWSESTASDASHAMLHDAIRLGIDFIDTARAYGRSEEVIADALHPYPEGLVIATKGGLRRGGIPDGRPERLRADCEQSLRALRLETIDLWQLHRIDPDVPLEEQVGAIRDLRDEGKLRFAGLSEVSLEQLERARRLIDVASVQNRFSLADQSADDVLRACEADGIAFIPWAPVARAEWGGLTRALSAVAARHGATPTQIALAWLLQRSRAMLPIPGTGSVEHLRENATAGSIELSADDLAALRGENARPRPRGR